MAFLAEQQTGTTKPEEHTFTIHEELPPKLNFGAGVFKSDKIILISTAP